MHFHKYITTLIPGHIFLWLQGEGGGISSFKTLEMKAAQSSDVNLKHMLKI